MRWIPILLVLALAGCADEPATDPEPTGSKTQMPTPEPTSEAPREPVTWEVVMRDNQFLATIGGEEVAASFTIQVGDTVHWTNEDVATVHDVVDKEGSFDSGDMHPVTAPEFSWTFDTVGEVAYFCSYHPGTMDETITVLETFSGTPADPQ